MRIRIKNATANMRLRLKVFCQRCYERAMTTLSERIHAIRQAHKMTQTEFADRLETTQSTVTRWEKGSVPSGEYLQRIADFAGTTVERLIGLDDIKSHVNKTIPVVGYVGAGALIVPFDDFSKGDGLDYIDRPPFIQGRVVAVEIRGDSLFPVAENGWRLVYAGEQTLDESEVLNRLCVVKLVDGTTLVKRVLRGAVHGRYHLASTNAAMIEDAEIEWAAPIKAIIPN